MLHSGGITNCLAEHLHASADTDDKTCMGVLLQGNIQAGFFHPKEIIHGLLAARQNDYIGLGNCLSSSTEKQRHRRLRSQGIKVGKVRKRGQRNHGYPQSTVSGPVYSLLYGPLSLGYSRQAKTVF